MAIHPCSFQYSKPSEKMPKKSIEILSLCISGLEFISRFVGGNRLKFSREFSLSYLERSENTYFLKCGMAGAHFLKEVFSDMVAWSPSSLNRETMSRLDDEFYDFNNAHSDVTMPMMLLSSGSITGFFDYHHEWDDIPADTRGLLLELPSALPRNKSTIKSYLTFLRNIKEIIEEL